LSIPIRWVMRLIKRRESTKISDSKWTKNSTWDLECQCKESWNVLELTMSSKRDGSITEPLKDGYLIQFLRLLETETGLLMYSHRKEPTLDADPWTQDGSNSSFGELHSSTTKRRILRLLMFKVH
jgi:hypothetical protein